VHVNKLLASVPEILARPLTGDELQSADFIFTEHMSDLARDEQSRLSADLYHLAGWGIGSGLRIASGLESWAGIPPSRFLASPQAVTVVAPAYAELDADLTAHLADTDDRLPIPVPEMTRAEQADCGPAASVSLGWAGPAWDEQDFPAFYMAGRLLGGMHDSILMTELRRREGWSYSPWSAVRLRPHSTLLEVQARVGHLHVQRARQIIISAVCHMASTEPDALRTAYAASLGQVVIGMSSQAGLAGTVNHYDFLGIGLPGLDEIFAAASRVTPGDLGKAADRYLRADQAIGPQLLASSFLRAVNGQGLSGAAWPHSARGRPSGQAKEARVHIHRVPCGVQSRTGSRRVTVTATMYWLPVEQVGMQLWMDSMPRPTAWVALQVGQVMVYKAMVPRRDSGQPCAQPGACTIVPRGSWLSAR
jgi:hypothetical protein